MELVSSGWLNTVKSQDLEKMKEPVCVVGMNEGRRLAVVMPYALYADLKYATGQAIEVLEGLDSRLADTKAAAAVA